jgi:hypothetical protein
MLRWCDRRWRAAALQRNSFELLDLSRVNRRRTRRRESLVEEESTQRIVD